MMKLYCFMHFLRIYSNFACLRVDFFAFILSIENLYNYFLIQGFLFLCCQIELLKKA